MGFWTRLLEEVIVGFFRGWAGAFLGFVFGRTADGRALVGFDLLGGLGRED